MEERINGLESKLSGIESELKQFGSAVSSGFSKMEGNFTNIQNQLSTFKNQLAKLTKAVEDLQLDTNDGFGDVGVKLESLTDEIKKIGAVTGYDEQFNNLKGF